MKNLPFRSTTVATLALGISACAPLQQAPLVYASKVTVGLDVSLNVAENQGGAINIGVKSVDSAYVPVAVSKQIDERAKANSSTVDVQIIEAKYGSGSSADSSDEATRNERNRKIDEYFAKKKAADDANKAAADAESALAELNKTITEIDAQRTGLLADARSLPAAPAASAVPVTSDVMDKRARDLSALANTRSLQLPALRQDVDGTYNISAVVKRLDEILTEKRSDAQKESQGRLPLLRAASQTAAGEASRAKDEAIRVAGLDQTSKRDAMSVYGRFDSNGAGDAKVGTGQVLVGKVFSTGLASQNLTEAVMIEAMTRCFSSGFEVAKGMMNRPGNRGGPLV
jgi:hypothetical protein